MTEGNNNEGSEQSPFTRPGFLISAGVVAVIALMAVFVLWPRSEPAEESAPTAQEPEEDEQEPDQGGNEEAAEQDEAASDSVCGLPGSDEGEGASLTRAPEAEWEFSGTFAYPVSEQHGPAETAPEGYRYCFSQSPEGAVLAAANFIEAAESDEVAEWLDYAVSDGQYREELVTDIGSEGGEGTRLDVVGFQLMSYDGDEAVVDVAVTVSEEGMTADAFGMYHLVWEDGDWKINGDMEEPLEVAVVGSHGSGFVRWSQEG